MTENNPIKTIRIYDAAGDTLYEKSARDWSGAVSGVEFHDGHENPALEVCLDDETQQPKSFLASRGAAIVWEPGWEHDFALRIPDNGNDEINAMAAMHKALHRIDEEARARVLQWVSARIASEAS